MSGFDHDAAMKRGVKRQEAVDHALREAHEYVDRQQTAGDNEVLIRLAVAVLLGIVDRQPKVPTDPGLDAILKRKASELLEGLTKESQSEYEDDGMALALAKKLLDSGTSKIISNMGLWESKTFREGARTS